MGQTITETDGSNDSRNGGSTISEIPCQTITETLGSTRYYATGFHAVHEVTSFAELENIDLTKKSIMGN